MDCYGLAIVAFFWFIGHTNTNTHTRPRPYTATATSCGYKSFEEELYGKVQPCSCGSSACRTEKQTSRGQSKVHKRPPRSQTETNTCKLLLYCLVEFIHLLQLVINWLICSASFFSATFWLLVLGFPRCISVSLACFYLCCIPRLFFLFFCCLPPTGMQNELIYKHNELRATA